ncbi:TnsA endonuclease C terminal [Clostridium cavendishii DSM 21758]|uniref:TnsA endonuclease C terminal n=1 Tax=Clostridium cavendishii DSM 21758 TaxID=1121302 RepID=A0A1M6LVW3_9CLOT|nr:heteromeric transposase endonuclease subunit TnsA [Clostridium cavendishii]SHJ75306.1 TnsA endonuclease C terminal [Clostridium cavendishii DSM 21758]
MAKRSRINKIEKLIKEGRGTGRLGEYKPWILIQDVSSSGRSTRLKGIKTKRQHDFLSDMETNYFYILEYADSVIDIREQYPLLPIEETLQIANELGIEHPKNPRTNEYIVMTTDFFITQNNNLDLARTVKSKDDLCNKRVLEKFEIERVYWERKGIDWGIVTNEEINKTVAQNIKFFHSYYDISNLDVFIDLDEMEIQDIILEYIRRISDTNISIREISRVFENDLSLLKGTGISVFKYLLARKVIEVDITKEIDINKSMDISLKEKIVSKEFNIS